MKNQPWLRPSQQKMPAGNCRAYFWYRKYSRGFAVSTFDTRNARGDLPCVLLIQEMLAGNYRAYFRHQKCSRNLSVRTSGTKNARGIYLRVLPTPKVFAEFIRFLPSRVSLRTLRPQEYQFYHSLLNHIAEFGLQTRRFMARRVLRETLLRRRTLCYIFLFLFCFFFIVCSTASCCSSLIFNGFLFLGIRLGQISFKAFSNTSVNCKHCSYISRKY